MDRGQYRKYISAPCQVSSVKYRLLRGGAANFQLPTKLAAETCVLNIDSTENECFKYAVVAGLYHHEIDQHNKNRRAQYDGFFQQYDFSTVKYPATVEDICKFMESNKEIAVNALPSGWER